MPKLRLLGIALLAAAGATPQTAAIKTARSLADSYRQNILESAAKLPEADYNFKPSPDVMTVREMLAHIGDANYSICSPLKGDTNANPNPLGKRSLSKAELIDGVKASFDYCLGALDATTDAQLGEMYKRGTVERPKAYAVMHLLDHTALHYGNLITYLRIKGLVPPETERRQAQQK
jgi:uncharacterized damage-inducible protein DinB